MDRSERRLFTRRWYQAVRSQTAGRSLESDANSLADDLARVAESLRDLAAPLLLSMLALVHFNQRGLSLDKTTLYDYATLAMLGKWDRDPAGRDLGGAVMLGDWSRKLAMDESTVRRIVAFLAHRFQVAEAAELTQDIALDALAADSLASSNRRRATAASMLICF